MTTEPFKHADKSWDWALEKIAALQSRLDSVKEIADCADMWRDAIEDMEFWSYSEELRMLGEAVRKYGALLKEENDGPERI